MILSLCHLVTNLPAIRRRVSPTAMGRIPEGFIKCSQETMLIQGPTPLDIRKIHSYPSCAKTLRGCGGDVVYMEEAAFMALDVFFEVIVPLLEMETTALIAISTPLDGRLLRRGDAKAPSAPVECNVVLAHENIAHDPQWTVRCWNINTSESEQA